LLEENVHLLLLLSQVFNGDLVAAHRTLVLLFHPLSDAWLVEKVRFAWQKDDLRPVDPLVVILVEIIHADSTRLVLRVGVAVEFQIYVLGCHCFAGDRGVSVVLFRAELVQLIDRDLNEELIELLSANWSFGPCQEVSTANAWATAQSERYGS